ncbi:NADPH-dependent F420 reductase [Nocardioides marmoribigeumensis]|uniref:Dinucleotide-binding enzyme n=1 Tax=Nocardioides marmoribigeumensis TaxID=433649 RepID=A0ABU2BWV3_9ACTN|nr:NAD(P)-binding domain-containing protein [Nocardioides marmoribigeumensis]MDR7362239.1 putative dinucleotide-binding enzyme [Nocardioides marmoribigeumensis]
MRIAVLGTGMVGKAIGGRLTELGHDVTIGTRDPAVTGAREGDLPAPLATYAAAAAGAELVVNASNGLATLEVLGLAGADNLAGKVLVDVSNPLDFSQGMPPTLSIKDTDSLGEQVQRAFPDARVVKTLNTMNADLMVHPEQLGRPHSVFVSGEDAEAKQVVTGLLGELGHTDVVDLGGIETARGTEMYLPLWLRLMGALGTPAFNVHVVR